MQMRPTKRKPYAECHHASYPPSRRRPWRSKREKQIYTKVLHDQDYTEERRVYCPHTERPPASMLRSMRVYMYARTDSVRSKPLADVVKAPSKGGGRLRVALWKAIGKIIYQVAIIVFVRWMRVAARKSRRRRLREDRGRKSTL
jgi:hypothetical protein